jgi:hypothetical protein
MARQPLIWGAGDQRRGHGGGEWCFGAKLKYNAAHDVLFGQNADGAACAIQRQQGRCPRGGHGGDGLTQLGFSR